MTELSLSKRREGLEFANKLAELAAEAPDPVARSMSRSAINRLRRYYGLSWKDKQVLVRRAIALGCATYDDLVAETRLPKEHICTVIQSLRMAGEVDVTSLPPRTNKGGRPSIFIRLVETVR